MALPLFSGHLLLVILLTSQVVSRYHERYQMVVQIKKVAGQEISIKKMPERPEPLSGRPAPLQSMDPILAVPGGVFVGSPDNLVVQLAMKVFMAGVNAEASPYGKIDLVSVRNITGQVTVGTIYTLDLATKYSGCADEELTLADCLPDDVYTANGYCRGHVQVLTEARILDAVCYITFGF